MAETYETGGPDPTDRLPVADVLAPAIVAAALIALGELLLAILTSLGGSVPILDVAFDAVGTAGLVAALVYVALLGPEREVLVVAAVVAYVASFVGRTLHGLVDGWLSLDLALVLDPVGSALLVLGFGLALRWVREDHPLFD